MKVKKASNLALAMAMLFVGWSLLAGTSPASLWRSLTGDTDRLISGLADRYGLRVHYGKGTASLPSLWQIPPVSGTAAVADVACVSKFMPVIQDELNKYNPLVLKDHFHNLYLYKSLTLFGVSYGATVQGKDVLLTLDCQRGYTDQDVAKALHHELSSLFLKGKRFPSGDWIGANDHGFRYMDNENEVLAAVSVQKDLMGNPELYRQGFLAEYGKTTLENDINLYAEVAMVEPDRLAKLVGQYPRVAVKARLLSKFYQALVGDEFRRNMRLIAE